LREPFGCYYAGESATQDQDFCHRAVVLLSKSQPA